MSTEIFPLRDRLRAAVPAAMKARDRSAVSGLRSALAAIENAEAVTGGDDVRAGAIEASPLGVGAAEIERRALTEKDITTILTDEISERRTAASAYEATGHNARAAELLGEAEVLAAYLT